MLEAEERDNESGAGIEDQKILLLEEEEREEEEGEEEESAVLALGTVLLRTVVAGRKKGE